MAAPKFSRIVKRWRSARQLSRADAARKLGVPYRTLEDWEAGKRTPTGIRRRLLEQMFNEPTLTAKQLKKIIIENPLPDNTPQRLYGVPLTPTAKTRRQPRK